MYSYRRMYRGEVRGVVLDWAGTTLDYGCFAPTMVFVDGFAARGVTITIDEARAPMGMYKRDHIAAILALPGVAARWQAAHGADPTDADVDALFADFIPRQMAVLAQYSDLIPGTVETINTLRDRGLKIGSCTGYTRAMMAVVVPLARDQGYAPDAVVCPDDVTAGRPAPWMAHQNAMQLGIYPMAALVKVGDTVVDVEEGLNAGMWTIGIAQTGNELGLTAAEVAALPAPDLDRRLRVIHDRLYRTGAHYVVNTLTEIVPVIEDINQRLARGEQP